MDAWGDWIRERWGRVALGLAVAVLALGWWQGRQVAQPPGVLAPLDPVQTAPGDPTPWTFRDHQITPLARFELRARVLAVERYRFDRAAQLAPVDFVLGWGPMSDSRVLQAFTIRQQDRWYFWSSGTMPIPADQVISHSANMHLVPATDGVRRRLLAVKAGQLVELRGALIRADGKDGWHWISSLTRLDTGDGSCEVVWVEAARAVEP